MEERRVNIKEKAELLLALDKDEMEKATILTKKLKKQIYDMRNCINCKYDMFSGKCINPDSKDWCNKDNYKNWEMKV